jgi:predicted PolB exonuclease-like 3'-5' exonuclease
MSRVPLHNILFLDIETVSQYPTYNEMSTEWKGLWDLKSVYLLRNRENETSESIYGRAAIYAEFGKIICISCGVIPPNCPEKKIIIKSFCGDDEKVVLFQFCEMLNKWTTDSSKYLCAHNGREFDYPFLCRRLIINHLPIPTILQISGKKPWEVNHLDTLELWKFGDFKNYTSLNLLAQTLSIPTSKDDIDGSMVGTVYWTEKNLPRIVHYCQKDVVTVAQIYLKMNGETLIKEENIEIKE